MGLVKSDKRSGREEGEMGATGLRIGETFLIDLGDGAKSVRILHLMPAGDADLVSFRVPEEPCQRPRCEVSCAEPCRKFFGYFYEPEGEPGRLIQREGTKIKETGGKS